MRAFSLVILLGLALVGAAEGDRASAAASQGALKIDRSNAGKPVPAITFVDRRDKPHKLAEFQGRPTVVNLWATWCAPCKAEMPALDRYAARMKGKVNVVTVAQDIEGWRAVDKFFKPGRFKALPAYLDQPTELALAYKAKGLPVTIGYDAKGRELWRVNGPIEWDDAAAVKQLASPGSAF